VFSVHKVFIRLTFFVTLAFVSYSFTQAKGATCVQILAAQKEVISQKLTELPELREMVLRMIDDPLIPMNIKRILEVALIRKNTQVRQLTAELRKELKIPEELDIDGAYTTTNLAFRRMNVGNTLNQKFTEQADFSSVQPGYSVFVQNRVITSENNDFSTLVHELSHVRFNYSLERQLTVLLKKLPPDLIRKASDGVVEISGELFDFLTERYAFQTEFELLEATQARYYKARYSKFPPQVTRENYKSLIAAHIISVYNITDPRVVRLKDFSISDILLGKPF